MLGTLIKELREEKGFTQKHIAEVVGVSQMAMYRIEKNETKVDANLLFEISKALDVDIKYFFKNKLTHSVNNHQNNDQPGDQTRLA